MIDLFQKCKTCKIISMSISRACAVAYLVIVTEDVNLGLFSREARVNVCSDARLSVVLSTVVRRVLALFAV